MTVSKISVDSKKSEGQPEGQQGTPSSHAVVPAQKAIESTHTHIVIPSLRGRASQRSKEANKPEKPLVEAQQITLPEQNTSLPSVLSLPPLKRPQYRVQFPDGSIYQGQFLNYYPHGIGCLLYPNRDKYKGEFFNGQPYGWGILNYANGDIYKGRFNNSCPHGKGTYIYANGNIYEGSFKNSTFDGQGTLTFTNQDAYQGEFKNGRFEGPGKFTFADGQPPLEGEFACGKFVSK
jgi:hypothetical protein